MDQRTKFAKDVVLCEIQKQICNKKLRDFVDRNSSLSRSRQGLPNGLTPHQIFYLSQDSEVAIQRGICLILMFYSDFDTQVHPVVTFHENDKYRKEIFSMSLSSRSTMIDIES
eukprot:GHVP01003781.1.p1 GENE.GHVP01003781.1~~GHVP01003781.1.p1  ORF type:complete len:113 (-),score=10.27 GHVP01003781.1:207-545(-)